MSIKEKKYVIKENNSKLQFKWVKFINDINYAKETYTYSFEQPYIIFNAFQYISSKREKARTKGIGGEGRGNQ